MKWSLVIGKFWGTEVRLHASMLLLIPYAMIMYRPNGVEETAKLLLLIVAIFTCVALHEMGHTVAARMVGISVNSIVLWPLGGFANLSRRPTKTIHDIFISAAGPFVNLVLFSIFAMLTLIQVLAYAWQDVPSVDMYIWFERFFPFLLGLLFVNLSLVVTNLLPIYPLDGGQITRNLIKMAFGEKRADQVMLVLSLPPALLLTIAGFITRDLILTFTGLLLLLAISSLNTRLSNGLILAWLYLVDRGGYHLRRQDYDPAMAAYNKAIERRPKAPGLYVNRAICHMNFLDFEAAKRDTAHALELDPKNFIAWTLQGELLALEKAYPEAMESFNKAITLQPHWALVYLDRGGLYQEQGMFDLALADMDHSLELNPGTGIGHVLRSALHYQMGAIEKSREDAAQAYRFAPHWMLAFQEIFQNNFAGHLDWAMDYYNRAIEQMPRAYQAYQGRADAARVNGRMDWAAADYSRAIQLAPRQAELYLLRARTYLALGERALAAEDLQQADRLAARSHIRRQAQNLLTTHSGA